MQNYVYLVGDPETREAAVIDAAWDDRRHHRGRRRRRLHDHQGAGHALPSRPPRRPLHGHERDRRGRAGRPLADQGVHQQARGRVRRTRLGPLAPSDVVAVDAGDTVQIGKVPLTFVHTPGHTPGSQCFLVDGNLISGDTLFIGSCGRTDLPGSDPAAALREPEHAPEAPRRHRAPPGSQLRRPADVDDRPREAPQPLHALRLARGVPGLRRPLSARRRVVAGRGAARARWRRRRARRAARADAAPLPVALDPGVTRGPVAAHGTTREAIATIAAGELPDAASTTAAGGRAPADGDRRAGRRGPGARPCAAPLPHPLRSRRRRARSLYERVLDGADARDRRWVDVGVALDAFAGRSGTLRFETRQPAARPPPAPARRPRWWAPPELAVCDGDAPSLLLITIDALRADHLGSAGYAARHDAAPRRVRRRARRASPPPSPADRRRSRRSRRS